MTTLCPLIPQTSSSTAILATQELLPFPRLPVQHHARASHARMSCQDTLHDISRDPNTLHISKKSGAVCFTHHTAWAGIEAKFFIPSGGSCDRELVEVVVVVVVVE